MKIRIAALALALVLNACGGGGGSAPADAPATPVAPSAPAAVTVSTPTAEPATPTGASTDPAPASGAGIGTAAPSGASVGDGAATGASVSAGAPSAGQGSGSATDGTGTSAATGDAATGATASNGTNGNSGVGSGGTGISVGEGPSSGSDGAEGDGVGIGAASGFGSVIVNGVRWDTSTTSMALEDIDSLKLGMTLRVSGRISADRTLGTATVIVSAAELRGPVAALNAGAGTLQVLGTTVSTDEATVFDGVNNLAGLSTGAQVMVHGLPIESGSLRATRIELGSTVRPAILTGFIGAVDPQAKTLRIGSTAVSYRDATLGGGWTPGHLQEGQLARVRAGNAPVAGALQATSIEPWYTLPTESRAQPVVLSGIVGNYQAGTGFTLAGSSILIGAAKVTGGPAASLGNGVKVEVTATLQNGVVTATRIHLKSVPGTGGPSSFSLIGTVGAFRSAADFKVNGQPVNASLPGVVFTGGTAAQLRNGTKLTVTGSTVVNGVLQAERVDFN